MSFVTERPYFWLFTFLALSGFAVDQGSKYGVFTHLYSEDLQLLTTPHIQIIPDAFRVEATYVHVGPDGRFRFERDPGNQPLSFLRTISGPCLPRVNRGALFGIGNADAEAEGMNHLFALISLVAAVFIIVWASRATVARDRFLSMALGLILGGTLGNLYDRLVFSGVRDFLHWYYAYDWPVFNIADCCLVCGAGVLLVHSFVVNENPANTQGETPSQEPAKLHAVATRP